MYITMDMGSTNTRAVLCGDDGKIIKRVAAQSGVRTTVFYGKDALFDKTKGLLSLVMTDSVRFIVVSGMATSELGLCEAAHIPLAAGIGKLSHAVVKKKIERLSNVPFYFIPGLKKLENGVLADMMRGEETELFGCIEGDGCYLLPGTHNKTVIVKDGVIADFSTSMSGEILRAVMENTMLKEAVSFDSPISEDYLKHGAEYGRKNGLNAAAFRVRILSKHEESDMSKTTSFLMGAVLGQDIDSIKKSAGGMTVYVAGNAKLKRVYSVLLDGCKVLPLSEEKCSDASHLGADKIIGKYLAEHNE